MKRYIVLLCVSIVVVGMIGSAHAYQMDPSADPVLSDGQSSSQTLLMVFAAKDDPFDPAGEPGKKPGDNPGGGSPGTNGPSEPDPGATAVPEPSTLLLLGLGLIAAVGLARRKK